MTPDTHPTRDKRRRRAQIFGDLLPESTDDDRDVEEPASRDDDWLRANVPPHHG